MGGATVGSVPPHGDCVTAAIENSQDRSIPDAREDNEVNQIGRGDTGAGAAGANVLTKDEKRREG